MRALLGPSRYTRAVWEPVSSSSADERLAFEETRPEGIWGMPSSAVCTIVPDSAETDIAPTRLCCTSSSTWVGVLEGRPADAFAASGATRATPAITAEIAMAGTHRFTN